MQFLHYFLIKTIKISLMLSLLTFQRQLSLKMLLFYSYLKTALVASLTVYAIYKVIDNISYLTFPTCWQIVQHGNRFSGIVVSVKKN